MNTFKIVSKIRKMDVWNIVKDAMTVSNEAEDATEEPVKIKRRNRRRRQKTNEVNQVRL